MQSNEENILFSYSYPEPHCCHAKVTITAPFLRTLYQHTIQIQKEKNEVYGFAKGKAPLHYVERTYRPYILQHLKKFFFNHCVVDFLADQIKKHNIISAGNPYVKSISIEPETSAEFTFNIIEIKPPIKNDWKKLSIKQPSRKNYKDIDRQAQMFTEQEEENCKNARNRQPIDHGDWVQFSITILDDTKKKLLHHYENVVWIRIGYEEVDRQAQHLFLGKYIRSCFETQENFLQKYLSDALESHYNLGIEILDHISLQHFSLDQYKHHFKIANNRQLQKKLIEVFSFRNDITQRRETVEAAFQALIQKYPFAIPRDIIKEQEQEVLRAVSQTPDYRVYKSQRDFSEKVRILATKQLKECMIIDEIASQERIKLTAYDIQCYFNFLKRPRMKQFIYFDLPKSQINGQETPLPTSIINQACLREKTLNYIIRHIIKQI